MKIFFVNPPFKAEYGKFSRDNRSPAITKSGCNYYPLWLIYSAAVAEKEGFEVEFLDAPCKPLNKEQALSIIAERGKGTKLFVVESTTPSIYEDVDFAGTLKERYPEAFVALAGTHVSVLAEETLELDVRVDGAARGEYDYIVRDLAKAIRDGKDLSEVRGLTYRQGNFIKENERMPYIENVDEIPFASAFIRKYLNVRDYFMPTATFPEIQIFTGRGCPFRCNYCLYPQTMHGHKYRARSAENVAAEFAYIAKNFPEVREIVIEDDTFTVDKERVRQVCRLLIDRKLNKKLHWMCNSRVTLDYETMKLMKKAGCRLLLPGFESGSQQILNNIKKGTKVEQFKPFVDNAVKAGLLVHGCFMFGNRGETKETMKETLRVALTLRLDTAQFYPLMPFPGTEAYDWAVKNGYMSGRYTDYLKEDGNHNTSLHLDGITTEEMVEFCDYARRKFYLRPGYIWHRICQGVRHPDDLARSLKAFKRLKGFLKSKSER